MNFTKRDVAGGGRSISQYLPRLIQSGFTLDTENQNFTPGDLINAGTLLSGDEHTRKAKVLKSGRVVKIDTDTTIITLEENEYIRQIFCVGDKVLKAVSGTFADAPSIEKIEHNESGCVLTLSAAITGLKVGDSIFQVISNGSANASLISNLVYMVPVDTEVKNGVTTIGAADEWTVFERRIPPIPSTLKQDNGNEQGFLKANPLIRLSQTF